MILLIYKNKKYFNFIVEMSNMLIINNFAIIFLNQCQLLQGLLLKNNKQYIIFYFKPIFTCN